MSNFFRKCRLFLEALAELERIAAAERDASKDSPFEESDMYCSAFLAGYRQALRDASHKFMDIF